MKLYEALLERKALESRRSQLQHQLVGSVKVRQDEADDYEDPMDILADYNTTAIELRGLVRRINQTNAHTYVSDPIEDEEISISDLIVLRESQAKHAGTIRSALEQVVGGGRRDMFAFRTAEAVVKTQVEPGVLRTKLEAVSAVIRRYETALQTANVQTDLVD